MNQNIDPTHIQREHSTVPKYEVRVVNIIPASYENNVPMFKVSMELKLTKEGLIEFLKKERI